MFFADLFWTLCKIYRGHMIVYNKVIWVRPKWKNPNERWWSESTADVAVGLTYAEFSPIAHPVSSRKCPMGNWDVYDRKHNKTSTWCALSTRKYCRCIGKRRFGTAYLKCLLVVWCDSPRSYAKKVGYCSWHQSQSMTAGNRPERKFRAADEITTLTVEICV